MASASALALAAATTTSSSPGQHVDDGEKDQHGHAVGHALGDEAVAVVVSVPPAATVRDPQGADPAAAAAGRGERGRSRCVRCRGLFTLILRAEGGGSRDGLILCWVCDLCPLMFI